MKSFEVLGVVVFDERNEVQVLVFDDQQNQQKFFVKGG